MQDWEAQELIACFLRIQEWEARELLACLLPQDPGVKSAGVTGLLAQPQERELLELQYFFT